MENASHHRVEIVAALEASSKHLESLRKEATQVKARQRCLEEELLSYEASNVEILNLLEQVNEEKLKSQKRLQVATMELEDNISNDEHG